MACKSGHFTHPLSDGFTFCPASPLSPFGPCRWHRIKHQRQASSYFLSVMLLFFTATYLNPVNNTFSFSFFFSLCSWECYIKMSIKMRVYNVSSLVDEWTNTINDTTFVLKRLIKMFWTIWKSRHLKEIIISLTYLSVDQFSDLCPSLSLQSWSPRWSCGTWLPLQEPWRNIH